MPISVKHVHNDPTPEQLHRRYNYNAETGVFTWKDNYKKGQRVGKDWAGTEVLSGRVFINWDKRQVQANRMAWIMTHGPIPAGMEVGYKTPLDPQNREACGNYANRIANLRLVSREDFNRETQKRIEKRCRESGKRQGRSKQAREQSHAGRNYQSGMSMFNQLLAGARQKNAQQ